MEPPDTEQAGADGPDVRDELEELATALEAARFTTAFRGFEPREVMDLLSATAKTLWTVADRMGGYTRGRVDASAIDAARVIAEAEARAAMIVREAEALREHARSEMLQAIRDANALRARAQRDEPG